MRKKVFLKQKNRRKLKGINMDITKYEKARIIGARAFQLYVGAPPLVEISDKEIDYIKIAEKEFKNNVIPIEVVKKQSD